MIRSIHISNYALIDKIDIDFDRGFNIITGETGAGKSIILGALGLLLGGRADTRAVGDQSRKSIIEAIFEDADGQEIILRREILPGGRSRAFIDDSPVTLAELRTLGIRLVDIHSQHRNMALAEASFQLEVVDILADNAGVRQEYRKAYDIYRKALRDYTSTRDLIRRSSDDADYIAFQFEQLDSLNVQRGEDTALEHERELLANREEIKEHLAKVTGPLSEDNSDALSRLRTAVTALESLAALVDESASSQFDFHSLAERLESARVEVADIAGTVAAFDSVIDDDAGRLQEVEERLAAIYSLESKHHVDSADALVDLRDRMASDMAALSNAEETLAELERKARKAKKNALELAEQLTATRMEAGERLAAELRARAVPLGLANLRCSIAFTRGKLGPDGIDQVQYLFAFNKNQALTPVGATASGGEISRLMLTLKSIVAERMSLPTIVFDEVDTGVSGDVAVAMAAMMASVGRKIQVITITHLPGVAAMGERHFKVFKEDTPDATHTRIRCLDDDERCRELAAMLGMSDDADAIGAARALIRQAHQIKNNIH